MPMVKPQRTTPRKKTRWLEETPLDEVRVGLDWISDQGLDRVWPGDELVSIRGADRRGVLGPLAHLLEERLALPLPARRPWNYLPRLPLRAIRKLVRFLGVA